MPHYNSELFRLSFDYPEEWLVLENKEIGGMQAFPPQEESEDQYSANLSIIIREQEQEFGTHPSILNYITNEIIKSNYASHADSMLLGLQANTIQDRPSRELVYQYTDDRRKQVMMAWQTVVTQGHRIILLTYTSKQEQFNAYLEGMKSIVFSLKIEA